MNISKICQKCDILKLNLESLYGDKVKYPYYSSPRGRLELRERFVRIKKELDVLKSEVSIFEEEVVRKGYLE